MSIKIKILTALFITFCFTNKTFAQSPSFLQHTGLWLGYTVRKPVGKKFSWNSDVQLRFWNSKAFYDYTLLRSGLQYELNKHFSTSAGILYGQDNYEGKTLPTWKNEKRLWQECRYFFGKLTALEVMLQFRLEQRWFIVENAEYKEEEVFAWRFRHRIDVRKSVKENWRMNVSDEVMFQNSKGKSILNQNRLWCGISRTLSHRNEVSAQLMLISWKAPDATVLRLNFLHQL